MNQKKLKLPIDTPQHPHHMWNSLMSSVTDKAQSGGGSNINHMQQLLSKLKGVK